MTSVSSCPSAVFLLWLVFTQIAAPAKGSDFDISFGDSLGRRAPETCIPSPNSGFFPNRSYGEACGDENEIPSLRWTPGPAGTQSYAIVILDLNTTIKSPSLVAWNIKSDVDSVSESVDWKRTGATIADNQKRLSKYKGPCPTRGDDFNCVLVTIYALGEKSLPLPSETGFDEFQSHLLFLSDQKKILAAATLYSIAVPHERNRNSPYV